jgi:flagellar biosynthesis/type III secretory pathway protein FliH
VARVIRGFSASAVVPREVRDAASRAAAIVAGAEARADALLEEARREADQIRGEARSAAEAEGRASVAALLALAASRRDRALAAAEREVIALATAVARRIVGETVERDPATVIRLAREAIARARGASQLTVRVAPEDVEALTAFAAEHRVALTVEPDATLGRGDCLVRSDVGTVDARLDTQVHALRDALLRELEREGT